MERERGGVNPKADPHPAATAVLGYPRDVLLRELIKRDGARRVEGRLIDSLKIFRRGGASRETAPGVAISSAR